MCHRWPCIKSKKFFQLQWKIKIIHFLVFEFFCMILVWFLGNHIWSLYDYRELIQITYDLAWLLRIIYDLVRNQTKLYDRWPGMVADKTYFFWVIRCTVSTITIKKTYHKPAENSNINKLYWFCFKAGYTFFDFWYPRKQNLKIERCIVNDHPIY